MPVLRFAVATLYSEDELEAAIQRSIIKAVKKVTNKTIDMFVDVSKVFSAAEEVREPFLAKTQDLLFQIEGIWVDLTGVDDTKLGKLHKGTFGDVANWIYGVVEKTDLALLTSPPIVPSSNP